MIEQPSIFLILIAFVAVLGPLIFLHELGHYGVARMFGVKADAFSIGFGKELLGWTDKRGTRWKVGALPLGGYVKFAGDMDPASQPDPDNADPSHFQNRPVWQRFLIVLAGPVANFLVAIAIFWAFLVAMGLPETTSRIDRVEPGGPAAEAGLMAGDEIRSIAGRTTDDFQDVMQTVMIRPTQEVAITYERAGEVRETSATIAPVMVEDRYGQEHRVGRLGIYGGVQGERQRQNPIAAVGGAVTLTWNTLVMMVDGIGQILFGSLSVKEIGGPIKMAQISGQQAQLGIFGLISLAALLSINLGFINLLPVPMLDGGHLMFYTIEAVRRRPVSAAAQEWAFRGGLALLLALIAFTTINDLLSIGVAERLGRLIG